MSADLTTGQNFVLGTGGTLREVTWLYRPFYFLFSF